MQRAVVIRGRLSRPRRIELDEDVTEFSGPVEVVLRSLSDEQRTPSRSIFELIATLPAGTRSKEDIDRQLAEERSTWEPRPGEKG